MSTSYSLGSLLNNSPSTTKDTYKSDVFFAGVIDKIRTFFDDDIFCDVTLVSKDNEYQVNAHKMVLSAASAYFLAMFGGSLREASEKVVKFPQTDGHSLKLVINYIYTASIEISIDTVEEIVKTAHLFELESLKVLCCDFIAKQLEPCNCLGIALFADHYNLNKLYRISEDYVCQNFDKVRNDKEFFDLDVEHLSKLLSSNQLRVESEESVFECIMLWVKYDKQKRTTSIETLLNCFRFPLVSPSFIVDTIEPACESIECERILYKAVKWHLLPEKRSSLLSENLLQPRRFTPTLMALTGWSSSDTSKNLLVGFYNFGSNVWTYKSWPAPSVHRRDFATTSLKGKLVIAGGCTNANSFNTATTNSVECLDLDTLKWVEVTPMQSKRYSFAMTALDDSVYVVGGKDYHSFFSTSDVKSIERWDPITKTWEFISNEDIFYDSSEFNVFSMHTKLCVTLKNRYSERIYHIYDPTANTWQKNWWKSSDPLGAGTVSSNEKEHLFIVVLRESIFKVNLQNDTTQTIAINPPLGKEFTKCAMFGDHVVIFGDMKFKIYYLYTNQWKTLADCNILGKVVLIANY